MTAVIITPACVCMLKCIVLERFLSVNISKSICILKIVLGNLEHQFFHFLAAACWVVLLQHVS